MVRRRRGGRAKENKGRLCRMFFLTSQLPSLLPPYCVEFPFQKAFLSLNRSSSSSCFNVWMLLPYLEAVGCLLLSSLLLVVEPLWSGEGRVKGLSVPLALRLFWSAGFAPVKVKNRIGENGNLDINSILSAAPLSLFKEVEDNNCKITNSCCLGIINMDKPRDSNTRSHKSSTNQRNKSQPHLKKNRN